MRSPRANEGAVVPTRNLRRRDRRTRGLAIFAGLLLALCGVSAVAQAQELPDPANPTAPGGTLDQNLDNGGNGAISGPTSGTVPDNDLTPEAKELDAWDQIAGATYPLDSGEDGTELVSGSVTDFADDLFTVSFGATDRGFAGGSRCLNPPSRASYATAEEYGEGVRGCDRGPVIYQYTDPQDADGTWRKAPLVPLEGADPKGYVGAIAWISTTKAVAVGGTGAYPRREAARSPTESYEDWLKRDVAGQGRAWVFDPQSTGTQAWVELDLSEQNAPCTDPEDITCGMRGMTALDFKQGANPDGFAGALGQLWEWDGDEQTFVKRVDRDSGDETDAEEIAGAVAEVDPVKDVQEPGNDYQDAINEELFGRGEASGAKYFDHRVRAIRFVTGEESVRAYAVTSGCCGATEAENGPRVLEYVKGGKPTPWKLYSAGYDPKHSTNTSNLTLAEPARSANRVSLNPLTPDSFYSLSVTPAGAYSSGAGLALSVVASPGGPERDGEQASMITARECSAQGMQWIWNFARVNLSTARLVSGDGDNHAADFALINDGYNPFGGRPSTGSPGYSGRGCPQAQSTQGIRVVGDGMPDWAMGELRSTRKPGLGARALAHTAVYSPSLAPETLDLNTDYPLLNPQAAAESQPQITGSPTSYELTSIEKLDEYRTSLYYLLPSYSLNAIEMVGESGQGWTVGDHGAILGIGGDGATGGSGAGEPEPPRLRPGRAAQLGGEAYQAQRPQVPPGGAGSVPARSAQPTESLERPELVGSGFADPTRPGPGSVAKPPPFEGVSQIVMSRDGSEGWGIGSTQLPARNHHLTLFHYSEGSWSRCDARGVPGLVAADPACADLDAVVEHEMTLLSAARVPLENDADPTNDDEFEVVAVGTNIDAKTQPWILRYRDGRWSVEDESARKAVQVGNGGLVRGIAFTAPDDGWILGPAHSTNTAENYKLFHFDGESWSDCAKPPGCADTGDRTVFDAGTGGTGALSRVAVDKLNGITAVGDRIYLYGTRAGPDGKAYPMIIWRQRGEDEEWHGSADGSDGSYDPGFDADADNVADGADAPAGTVESLSLTQTPEGAYAGWAVGSFGGGGGLATAGALAAPETTLARLEPSGEWNAFADTGAIHDYLVPSIQGRSAWGVIPELQATLPADADGEGRALIAQLHTGRIFEFDPEAERWGLLEDAGRYTLPEGEIQGDVRAIASDGHGGAWMVIRNGQIEAGGSRGAFGHDYFFHYTTERPKAVFEEAPNPFDETPAKLTSFEGAANGTLWAGMSDGTLYRYDRLTGWAATQVPGWDPGRVVTRPSAINAVAVGESGVGVAVGAGGRIADLLPGEVKLDRAAGTLCAVPGSAPCSTGHELTAAAVSPEGSAIVGGETATLLWRPGAEGDFRTIAGPAVGSGTTITDLSMPAADHAYLTTNTGYLYRGDNSDGSWSWRLENQNDEGRILNENLPNTPLPLNAIAVDAQGHGYAVGPAGVILERTGSGERPWRRLDVPYLDDLTAVTLGAGGGGALIGGAAGLVLSASGGEVEVARPADYNSEALGYDAIFPMEPPSRVVGVALLPGIKAGQTEAWIARRGHVRGDGSDRLYHYTNAPDEPLLDPETRVSALPDAPPTRPGELTLAALGKSECNITASELSRQICLEDQGSLNLNEVIMRRVSEELASDRPELALWTGDAVDTAGMPAQPATAATAGVPARPGSAVDGSGADYAYGYAAVPERRQISGPLKLRRFAELYARPLVEEGVPLLGALGGQDLSEVSKCAEVVILGCPGTKPITAGTPVSAGENLAWRQAFAGMPAPWGESEEGYAGIEGASDPDGSLRLEDVETVEDPSGSGLDTDVKLDGASTHYAADLTRAGEGSPAARVIVLDSSLGSATSSDPTQQPIELQGQLDFLDRMTCYAGTGQGCTRERGQAAIVVSNAPTYSYGPTAPTENDASAAVVEQHLISGDVDLLVSGKLGWNGLYYIRGLGGVPADHFPAAGEPHPSTPPEPLAGGNEPIPAVVASGAGGKFNAQATNAGNATASNGFWSGYTKIRLDPSGDYRDVVVEQRPILDWVRVMGPKHELRARQTLKLEGAGREPMGVIQDHAAAVLLARHDEINSPAITHRYDLLLADPTEPWMPATDASSAQADGPDQCGDYVCLPESVGTIDRTSGEVRAGAGKQPPTYAIALLSVGEKSASYPLLFEQSPSFKAEKRATPTPDPVLTTAPPPPPVETPPVPQFNSPSFTAPNIPLAPLVALPPLAAQTPASPPSPPVPPPAVPANPAPSPLDLSFAPTGLTVAPQASVIPPPAPPINPAPPGGARKEARQRQAAAQKGGADSGAEEGNDSAASDIDTADSKHALPGAAMSRRNPAEATRLDRTKPTPSFSAIDPPAQASAWSRGALYGGGIGLAAAALAMAFTILRPGPRRRQPEVPAAARGAVGRHR